MSEPKAAIDRRSRFELVGVSERSFSAATADAIARAGALFAELGWGDALGRFEVLTMRGPVSGGKRTGYEIRVRVALAETTTASGGVR